MTKTINDFKINPEGTLSDYKINNEMMIIGMSQSHLDDNLGNVYIYI
jgi:hypothetical protein